MTSSPLVISRPISAECRAPSPEGGQAMLHAVKVAKSLLELTDDRVRLAQTLHRAGFQYLRDPFVDRRIGTEGTSAPTVDAPGFHHRSRGSGHRWSCGRASLRSQHRAKAHVAGHDALERLQRIVERIDLYDRARAADRTCSAAHSRSRSRGPWLEPRTVCLELIMPLGEILSRSVLCPAITRRPYGRRPRVRSGSIAGCWPCRRSHPSLRRAASASPIRFLSVTTTSLAPSARSSPALSSCVTANTSAPRAAAYCTPRCRTADADDRAALSRAKLRASSSSSKRCSRHRRRAPPRTDRAPRARARPRRRPSGSTRRGRRRR